MGYIRRPTKAHKTYYVHWSFRGTQLTVTGYRSAKTSQSLLRNLERLSDAVEVGGGLPDDLSLWIRTGLDDQRREYLLQMGLLRPSQVLSGHDLEEYLGEWERHLLDCGRTASHASGSRKQASKLLKEAKAQCWADIDPERVLAATAVIKAKTSARTAQAYFKSLKTFCRWLVRFRGGGRSPLELVSAPVVKDVDLKKRRATLTDAQIDALVHTTRHGPTAGGMPGPERALFYHLVVATGIRQAGAMALLRSSFLLDSKTVVVRVTGKGGKIIEIPVVEPGLVQALKEHLEPKPPDARAFSCPASRTWMTRVFKRDLAAAKVEAPSGTSFDFHGIRTTFGTRTAAAGVPLEVVQEMMGHTDVRVTRRYYVHVDNDRKANELRKVCSAVCSEASRKEANSEDNAG